MEEDSVVEFFRHHPVLPVLLLMLFIYGAVTAVVTPQLNPALLGFLQDEFTLFMLSYIAVFYLIVTGAYLIYKGVTIFGDRKLRNNVPFIWGLSFLVYPVVQMGILLGELGVLNTSDPGTFFLTRQSMVLWAAGISYGLVTFRTDSSTWRKIIPGSVLVFGYAWLAWGIYIIQDISYTMYGFTSFIWVPITFVFGYLFWAYSGGLGQKGMRWISVGMVFMGITYILWAPTYNSFLYQIAFFHFNIALSLILLGMVALPWKEMSQVRFPFELVLERSTEEV